MERKAGSSVIYKSGRFQKYASKMSPQKVSSCSVNPARTSHFVTSCSCSLQAMSSLSHRHRTCGQHPVPATEVISSPEPSSPLGQRSLSVYTIYYNPINLAPDHPLIPPVLHHVLRGSIHSNFNSNFLHSRDVAQSSNL